MCYDIVAAQITYTARTNKKKNSTKLKRKARKDADKSFGNKTPRALNVDEKDYSDVPPLVKKQRCKVIAPNL